MKVRDLTVILLAFLTITCSQDPIFYIISKETAPQKPRIEGAPTNMVVFKRNGADIMCVASGRLHWYAKEGWDSNNYYIPQPGGKIISLAVTKTASNKQRLYALCFDNQNANATLRFIESDGNVWYGVQGSGAYPSLQSIYADPEEEVLFAGARGEYSPAYVILYLDTNNALQIVNTGSIYESGLLSGAVYRDNYFYLSTRRLITRVQKGALSNGDLKKEGIVVMGMIKLKDNDETIIAVERDGGGLHEVNENSIILIDNTFAPGKYATGALALWEDPSRYMRKLTAGVQGGLLLTSSSYSHGYAEFDLKWEDKSFDYGSPRRESNSLQTVNDAERYTTSLGRHPINHMFQTPDTIDTNRTFFASTQTAGLWSYRYRPDNGGWQWNAEE
jgi:hypothetical protein